MVEAADSEVEIEVEVVTTKAGASAEEAVTEVVASVEAHEVAATEADSEVVVVDSVAIEVDSAEGTAYHIHSRLPIAS